MGFLFKKIKLKLAERIACFVIILVMISVGVSVFISGQWYISQMMDNIEQNVRNIVTITAQSPIIIDGLESGVDDGSIQAFIQKTQSSIAQIDVMVVADRNGIRYGHTVNDRVGEMFSAEDHADAILHGETYVTVGPGTLGDSMRAFTPVFGHNGDILGFVMSGTLLDSIAQARKMILLMILGFIVFGSTIGVTGSFFLAKYIKKSLLSYEPEDIAKLYLENKAILATVHEGIIAVNQNHELTLINEAARDYLGSDVEALGQPIEEIFPQSRLPAVVDHCTPELDVQMAINDRVVMANHVPIVDEKGICMGGVASFRDQTEMNRLAEEITGVKKIVDALRATTHEFKNKLHVILGLIETDQLAQAKAYIGATNDAIQDNISIVLRHIEEPTIAALVIGKIQRCNELKIHFELDDHTAFKNAAAFDINSLVVVIGNLLDNATDCLDQIERTNKQIRCLLLDTENGLHIEVEDNGSGIAEPEKIFQKGYTTKQGSRGYGLFLLQEQVERYHGKIDLTTQIHKGTHFAIDLEGRSS